MRKWLLIYGLIGLLALAIPSHGRAICAPAIILGLGLGGLVGF